MIIQVYENMNREIDKYILKKQIKGNIDDYIDRQKKKHIEK